MALYQYLDLSPLRVKQLVAQGQPAPPSTPSSSGGFFSSGNNISINGGGGAYDSGGWVGQSNPTSVQQVGGMLSTVGKAGSLIGIATNNPSLTQTASNIGLIGNTISAPTALDAAQVVGSAAASKAGVPSPVISTVNGAINGYQRGGTVQDAVQGAVRGAVASIPGAVLGTVNPVLGLLGSIALSGPAAAMVDAVNLGSQVAPDSPMFSPFSDVVSQHEMGKAIQTDPDPIGALINALSPATEKDDSETANGVNVTTPGVTTSPVTMGTAVGTNLGTLSSTTPAFDFNYGFEAGGWSSDPTSGVDGSTAGTADSPDGPDGMNSYDSGGWSSDATSGVSGSTAATADSPDGPDGMNSGYNSGGGGGGGGFSGGYGGVNSGGYSGPGSGGYY